MFSVVGAQEMESRTVNIRNRDDKATQAKGDLIPLDEAIEKLVKLRDERRLVNALWEPISRQTEWSLLNEPWSVPSKAESLLSKFRATPTVIRKISKCFVHITILANLPWSKPLPKWYLTSIATSDFRVCVRCRESRNIWVARSMLEGLARPSTIHEWPLIHYRCTTFSILSPVPPFSFRFCTTSQLYTRAVATSRVWLDSQLEP